MRTPWLPDHFVPPARVAVPYGHHLRPIRAADVDLDLVAVLGSRELLRARCAGPRGWPPATLTRAQDLADLTRHEEAMHRRAAYTYALLDTDETALLGRVRLEPPTSFRGAGVDAEVTWWVVDECVGTPLETALVELVPRWVREAWPWTSPRFGDLSGTRSG